MQRRNKKKKYNDSLLETLFYPEKIEISLKEIFNNRNHFPITKIEQSEESIFILQLAKSHILEFKNKKNKNQKLIEIINIYENTKELQDFESYFTKIT